jgi:hypothetical protein
MNKQTIIASLHAVGSTVEQARIENRSLTKSERGFIVTVREAATKVFSPPMIETLEEEGRQIIRRRSSSYISG